MNLSTLYQEYADHGLVLVPIQMGQKRPIGYEWNHRENCVLPAGWADAQGGVGLAHAFCIGPTCAIDLDKLREALQMVSWGWQVDLQAYIDAADAVWIVSGRENHFKLLYRMPPGLIMPTAALELGGKHVLQFRCATKDGLTVQDLLPPTIHPETGNRYTWGGRGDWRRLPVIPGELLRIWQDLLEEKGRGPYHRSGPGLGTERGQNPEIPEYNDETIDRCRAMLEYLNPDMGRNKWYRVGMALHSVSEDLYRMWDEWSSRGAKYKGTGDTGAVWRSFSDPSTLLKGEPVTFGTLARYAYQAGYRDKIDAQALYRAAGFTGAQTPGPTDTAPAVDAPTPTGDAPTPVQGLPPAQGAPQMQGLTYEQLLEQAMGLAPMQDARDILAQAIWMTPTEQDRLTTTISEKTGVRAPAVREELNQLIRAARNAQHDGGGGLPEILGPLFSSFVHVGQLDVLFQPSTRSYYKPMAFEHAFRHMHEDVLELALDGGVVKVDRIDYVPGQAPLFEEDGVRYINMWTGVMNRGLEGDCSRWLNHFRVLGLEEPDIAHLLQWMAFTLRHPERKINHGVILSGLEGIGKDALFYPMDRALAENATVMDATALFSDFNAELLGRKFVRINETALGGERQSRSVEEKLKPMLATPPERVWVNEKGLAKFEVRNVFNVAITTNSNHPLHISTGSRRYFALRSEISMQDELGNMTPEWKAYWTDFWAWMAAGGGWQQCVWYLVNRVDLTGFNPGLAPPSTEFKRQIQAESMSPVEAAVKELLETREGVFSLPLIQASDVHTMFSVGRQNNKYVLRYGLKTPPTPAQLGKAVRDARLVKVDACMGLKRDTGRRSQHMLWVLEKPDNYDHIGGHEKVDLYNLMVEEYWEKMAANNVTPFK